MGLAFLIYSINEINKIQITPSLSEIDLLNKNYGNIKIKSKNDIIRLSQAVISKIHHKLNMHYPLNITKVIVEQKGYCYDRSLILQKIFIHNKIPIRPVFLYFKKGSKIPSIFNLFDKDLQSHSVFEFKYEGKWYLMKTNNTLTKIITLEEYINFEHKNFKYIRYLSNRNSKFIYPSYLPDIYWFN